MRILVTGLNGFTGYYLQHELETHGHTVNGLSSDLTNPKAVASEIEVLKPEAVVHLAGISYVAHGNSRDFYNVNLIGTQTLLENLYKYAPDLRSILLVSSANIYGHYNEDRLSEATKPNPQNDYATSKLAMEHMARLWVKQLPLFIVRPFNYTGVGQKIQFLIPKIVSHFQNKKPTIELGNLDIWREFGDVRSVVNAYRRLLENCPSGYTINVCSGKAYSLREVIALCEKITGHYIEVQTNLEFVRDNEIRVLKGSNNLLIQKIGKWKLFTLEETLVWMLGNI